MSSSHFIDFWKISSENVPNSFIEEPEDLRLDSLPLSQYFLGQPVHIHPLETPGCDGLFVTDDGSYNFTPENAIRNVHFERYSSSGHEGNKSDPLIMGLYYSIKRYLPRFIQLELQRYNARSRLRKVSYPSWPGDDSLLKFFENSLVRLMEIQDKSSIPFISFWPKGIHWAACFTHDVETEAGVKNINRMAQVENEFGIKSTWFFVPERYPITTDDFAELRENGHEIAIHGLNHDGSLFTSREEFNRRIILINNYLQEWNAFGFRSPALHRNPDWIPELKIKYDSSYSDTAILEPQTGGICTPFPFHLSKDVVEVPLTIPMDHYFINLLKIDTVSNMLEKFSWIINRRGLANFLFHPDYNIPETCLDDYRKIVKHVKQKQNGWIATAEQIADWLQRRCASNIVAKKNVYHIEGPAADEAVIWYARRTNEGIDIEIPG